MATTVRKFEGAEVTETMLEEAAKLFSEHYGIWGKNGFGKPATTLLLHLIDPEDDALGIMSSHPAACKALAKAVGDIRFADVVLDFAQAHAAGVLAASPIEYIQAAKLRGSLFDSRDTGGMIDAKASTACFDTARKGE
ncbi:hypothetical protein VD0002_g4337 [Verticillium dahliae]|uniref:Uncharacterized protein n=1 Tax=Verticillium dahliae TaxID=27337 RepID=A0AA45ANM4_VERDA|nr:hypothetical protein BJF96_g3658 [Verticillium dahliae]PNH40399.1 hypothetical protein VD0004_g6608 [Verticillium dahliae]PNH52563.1 hypothetical protein VD0003_g4778 [Verticillium dahliae]PNH64273.1 hypothetical protein VD0002_g4337 [Verticillium dahliae]PNH70917.1 hypothetical protein VD0001_g6631 [Verticillium dahliae]